MFVTSLAFLIDRLERNAPMKPVADDLFESRRRERSAGHQRLIVTLRAVVSEFRVWRGNVAGIEKCLTPVQSKKYDRCDSANDCQHCRQRTGASPWMQILVVAEIAFVTFGDLLLSASGFGHSVPSTSCRGSCQLPCATKLTVLSQV